MCVRPVGLLAVTLALAPFLAAQSLDAPAEANAGSEVSISFAGSPGERDFISIVPAATPEGKYKRYKYTKAGNPLKLLAPDKPGPYKVRWLSGESGYPTVASRPITIKPVSARLNAPDSVDAGREISISWEGPNNPKDFITIVEKGTPERKYKKYKYAASGNPVKLIVPDVEGEYEIRYLTGQDYLTLAARPLVVGGVSASLDAPTNPAAGEALSIQWTGPNNPRDFITIVPAGTPDRKYKKYVYAANGNPAKMQAPDEPGEYEIRYLTGQDYRTLAAFKVIVGATSASLDAPERVDAGRVPFEVGWTGPDNRGDFITIVPKGHPERKYGDYRYTGRGNPTVITSPLEAGEYEIRYLTGQLYKTLATRPLLVGPAKTAPGKLQIVAGAGASAAAGPAAGGAVEIILDASGSMLQRQDGRRRIDIAKETLARLTAETIPAGTPFALRIFGHKEADSCRTDLESPLKPLDPAAVSGIINAVEAKNLAKTPIAASLTKSLEDLRGVDGERLLVLITDGEETCEGDPAAAIETLRAAGVDVRVNIVGFAIDDEALKGQFRYWADLGGGGYFDASNSEQLGESLTAAVRAPYDAYSAEGQIVGSGIVGGDPIVVPAGTYVIRTRAAPAQTLPGILVEPDKVTVQNLPN